MSTEFIPKELSKTEMINWDGVLYLQTSKSEIKESKISKHFSYRVRKIIEDLENRKYVKIVPEGDDIRYLSSDREMIISFKMTEKAPTVVAAYMKVGGKALTSTQRK